MKAVYIAGPFTAASELQRRIHTNNALVVALDIAKAGAVPVVPHSQWAAFHGAVDSVEIMPLCLELLGRCDAAYFLAGWEGSAGSMQEMAFCLDNHMPVFFGPGIGSVVSWLR